MTALKPEIYQPTIRELPRDELPRDERPRERLREYGPRNLNNSELIAILLRTGMQGENVLALASRILSQFNGLAGLGKVGFVELCSQRGLSEAKACQLLAALELGKRLVSLAPEERMPLNSPQDVANLVSAEMSSLDQEHLRVLLLNTRHELLAIREIYSGNVSSAVVRVAEVFRPAIRDNAPFIIVVHNHPSGDPTPSEDDVRVTRDLVEAGKLLGVEVLDHVVIGAGNRFVSLNQKGLGFGPVSLG